MNFIKLLALIINVLPFKFAYAIWNGDPIPNLNNYQFMVSIQQQYTESGVWTHWCGGSLISPKFILTAGHCIADVTGQPLPINTTRLILRNGKEAFIKKFYLNPNFYWQLVSGFGYPYEIPENDLALIELINPVMNEEYVKLPDPNQATTYYATNNNVISIGYGWYDMQCDIINPNDPKCTVSYPLLRGANMAILQDSDMKWEDFSVIKASAANPYFYPSAFVGIFSNTQAPTAHDSGSPLLIKDSDSNFIVIGTFSTSINYPQLFQPSIYTRIATYENILWINNLIINEGIN